MRRTNLRTTLLILGVILLIILHSIVALFFVTNYFNWNNALNVDRSDKAVTNKNYYYQYPFSGPPYVTYGINSSGGYGPISGLPTFSVEIEMQYIGILTEVSPLFLASQGFLYPDGQQNISGIQVGYQGASWYSFIANYPAYVDVNPKRTDVYSMIVPSGTLKGINIKWDTQGDYYPFIILNFNNGSSPLTIPLEQPKVHVYGIEAIQQQEDARRNTGTNTSLFLTSLIAVSDVIVGYFSRVRGTKKIKSKPAKPKSAEHTYNKKQWRKKGTKKHSGKKRESENINSIQKKE